ncbi:MAG: FecR domain-containing protein, partial [Planctomycetes bacterium]|nr:FecR domain-containing protein [Planctomycetota bacterium]
MTGRQEELTAGWLDGSLSPEEQAELLEALKADDAFAREFAEEAEVHRALQFSSAQSEAGDRRAAERILHFVRASQEGTKFVENVRQRALAGARRPAAHPGTSHFGPLIAAAAALMVAALVGLVLMANRHQRAVYRQETAELRAAAERKSEPEPVPVRSVEKPAPPKPVEDEATRRKRIEEELRLATDNKKLEAPPKAAPDPAPPEPGEKPVAKPPKPDAPAKPETRVDAPPALARLESVQGEVIVAEDRTPAASGLELRDGASLETVGPHSTALLRFADGTRVELSGEAKLHEKLAGKRAAGKGLSLVRGSVAAEVSKQPAGQAFLFVTPHAEIQVIGTRLSIQSGGETRIDVQEGQVRVTSLKSGQPVTLSAGQAAEIGPAGPPHSYLQGLHAVYFDQNSFKGAAVERVDAVIDLFLDQAKNELPPVGTDRNFAVRWDGRFLAETAGEYVFLLSVDGQVKFVFDGQEAVADAR